MHKVIESVVIITNNKAGDLKIESTTPMWVKELLFDDVETNDQGEVIARVLGKKAANIFTSGMVRTLFGEDSNHGMLYHLTGQTPTFLLTSIMTDDSGTELKFRPKSIGDYVSAAKQSVIEEGRSDVLYAWEI